MATPSKELVEDLCTRFILTAPAEQHQSFEHLMFLVEEAHWYYEDTIRDRDRHLKSYTLNTFTKLIFEKCPELSDYVGSVEEILRKFKEYKRNVPAMGAIILDKDLERALLVKGVQSAACWGFPKGKINKDESEAHCAAREVFEETGFDIEPLLKEEDCISKEVSGKRMKLYIIPGVDHLTTEFHPKCKGEIGAYAWHKVADLPSTFDEDKQTFVSMDGYRHKFFMVWPFVKPLKDWLARKKGQKKRASPTPAAVVNGCANGKTSGAAAAAAKSCAGPSGTHTDAVYKKALRDTFKAKPESTAVDVHQHGHKKAAGGRKPSSRTVSPSSNEVTLRSSETGTNLLASMDSCVVSTAAPIAAGGQGLLHQHALVDPAILAHQPATCNSPPQHVSKHAVDPSSALKAFLTQKGTPGKPASPETPPQSSLPWPPGLLIPAKHVNDSQSKTTEFSTTKVKQAVTADELEKSMLGSCGSEPHTARTHLLNLLQRATSPPESPVVSPFTATPGIDILHLPKPVLLAPTTLDPATVYAHHQTTSPHHRVGKAAPDHRQQLLGWLHGGSPPTELSIKSSAPGHVLLGMLQRSPSPLSAASSTASSTSLDTTSASSVKSLAAFSFNLGAIMVELQ